MEKRRTTTAKGTLITVPKQEQQEQQDQKKTKNNDFLLLQLPDSSMLSKLLNQQQDDDDDDVKNNNLVRIVGGEEEEEQACLITQHQSFALSRVDTSNALVLVPPKGLENVKEKSLSSSSSSPPAAKKLKTTSSDNNDDAVAVKESPLRCNILGGFGGIGAYFLEMKERHINLSTLQEMLPILDPYNYTTTKSNPYSKKKNDDSSTKNNNNFTGISISDLSQKLLLSNVQIQNGLDALPQAIELSSSSSGDDEDSNNNNNTYCLLSEEGQQSVQRTIIATLTESDCLVEDEDNNNGLFYKFQNNLQFLVDETLKRIDEPYPQIKDVVRSVILKSIIITKTSSQNGDNNKKDEDDQILIDFEKVAILVAHMLFIKKGKNDGSWSEEELLQEWQGMVPGTTHKISTTLLKGIAIRIVLGKDDDDVYWKYLPIDKLSKIPNERLKQLFCGSGKEEWTKEELEIYLPNDYLVAAGGDKDGGGGKADNKKNSLDKLLNNFTAHRKLERKKKKKNGEEKTETVTLYRLDLTKEGL